MGLEETVKAAGQEAGTGIKPIYDEKAGKIKKKLIKILETLEKDVSRLKSQAEQLEKLQDIPLNENEKNFAAWDYKSKVGKKEKWIKYWLGRAMEFGMDKDAEIVKSIFPDTYVKISDYVVSRCQMYHVAPYILRIEAGLVEPAVTPAPTSPILPNQAEPSKLSETEQKSAAAGG
jgi:hypothetical protein